MSPQGIEPATPRFPCWSFKPLDQCWHLMSRVKWVYYAVCTTVTANCPIMQRAAYPWRDLWTHFGPFFEKIVKRYPIFSLQINYYQIDQRHKSNILLLKFYFNSFKNGILVFSPYDNNVKFYTVLTQKMIWGPLNCGSLLDKIYLWLHENVLKISLKIVCERICAF